MCACARLKRSTSGAAIDVIQPRYPTDLPWRIADLPATTSCALCSIDACLRCDDMPSVLWLFEVQSQRDERNEMVFDAAVRQTIHALNSPPIRFTRCGKCGFLQAGMSPDVAAPPQPAEL